MGNSPSIYESFNARNLSNKELSETFIISEHFQKLASSNHTIMIGPRGSGKTTLMRMLQTEALSIWNADEAPTYREKISFSGVFIPTDRLWKSQSEKLQDTTFLSNDLAKSLINAAFIYHILEKLIQCVLFRAKSETHVYRSIQLSKNDEAQLTQELSSLWKVTPRISSLKSLHASSTHKKIEISNHISALLLDDTGQRKPPITIEQSIASTLGASIALINMYFEEPDGKWCFLFDELELAPEEIIQPLVDSMRGGPENIIFKLSLSPYHRELKITSSPISSMRDQDLSFVSLTGASDKAGISFSKSLCSNIFKKNGLTENIENYFSEPKELNEKAIFEELSEKDPSFKDYLTRNAIEISRIAVKNNENSYTEADKRPTIRKVKFVAYLRNYYLKPGRKASRKRAPDNYAGFNNLCKALEYNPRMLIGVMNKLSKEATQGKKISISSQLNALREMELSFKSLLSTIAIDGPYNQTQSLYDIVNKIGLKLKNEIIGEKFTPEPKGTITFKSKESLNYFSAVGLALNAGALIIENHSNDFLFNQQDLTSARCRLSYLFSHHFGLLTTTGRQIDIGELFEDKTTYFKAIDPTMSKSQIDLL